MSSGVRRRDLITLVFLFLLALLLSGRIVYLFLADTERFPINAVKIVGNYQYIMRKQLANILTNHLQESFFSLSVWRLHKELLALNGCQEAKIERIWPDVLKISLIEKTPIAIWNDELLSDDGQLFTVDKRHINDTLPHLSGPSANQKDVLQIYLKLSKLLDMYGLHASSLQLRDNQAWELVLTNGIRLRLGKHDLEKRLLRFCKAYPVIFADKPEQLSSVDLRYARGMAVLWTQPTGK